MGGLPEDADARAVADAEPRVCCLAADPDARQRIRAVLDEHAPGERRVVTDRPVDGLARVGASDCVVVVHDPPTLDAIDVLDAVRERAPDVPVVVADPDPDVDPVAHGATDVVRLDETPRAVLASRIRDRAIRHRATERDATNYRETFANAHDGMLLFDDDATVVDANDRACDVLDRPRDGLVDAPLEQFSPHANRLASALDDRERIRDVLPVTRPDGTERVVDATVTRDVAPDRHLAVFRDVTDRRADRVELERLRDRIEFVLTRTNSLTWTVDGDTGDLVSVYGARFVGPDGDPAAIEGEPMRDVLGAVVHPDDLSAIRDGVERVRAGERDSFEAEFRGNPDADGVRERWFETAAHRRTDDTGAEVIGFTTDVTAQKRQSLELEAQNERLDRFASVVSHDLKTPLATAQGHLELARDSDDLAPLDDVAAAHDRMERIIDDLRWLTREGRDIGSTDPVDLADVVERAWRLVAPAGDATLVVADGLGTVEADGDRLRQLLENVLSNAVTHGGDDVTVRVEALPDGFAISDDGPGVPPDEREDVLDYGYSTRDAGTGYGLAIVTDIAAAHDWTLALTESERGGLRLEFRGVT
ncbi:MAG: ATP-binding protein [Halarchaeum sp.]